MYDDFIKIEESVEHYGNNAVKTYQSIILHTELNKSIKIRDRDKKTYNQRVNEAVAVLRNEWKVIEFNNSIKEFCKTVKNLHRVANRKLPFAYNLMALQRIKLEEGAPPRKPVYLELPHIPEIPNENDEKYIFNPQWHHSFFKLTDKGEESLKKQYEEDLNNYYAILDKRKEIEEENESRDIEYKLLYEKHIKKHRQITTKYNNVLKNYCNKESKEAVIKYYDLCLSSALEDYSVLGKISFKVDYDINNGAIIIDFMFPIKDVFPKIKEQEYLVVNNQTKDIPFTSKELSSLIKESYYCLYLAIVHEVFRIDTENIVSHLILNGYYVDINSDTKKQVCIMTSKIKPKEFSDLDYLSNSAREIFKLYSGIGNANIENIIEVKPLRTTKNTTISKEEFLKQISSAKKLNTIENERFNTLIHSLFKLEFAQHNIEVLEAKHLSDSINLIAQNKNDYISGILLLHAKQNSGLVTEPEISKLIDLMKTEKAIRGIYVTSQDFEGDSRKLAISNNIKLINGEQLAHLLNNYMN